jgi:hypothetical protein
MELYQHGFKKLNNGVCAPLDEGLRAVIKIADESDATVGEFKISWVDKDPNKEPAIGEWVPEVIVRAYKYEGEED